MSKLLDQMRVVAEKVGFKAMNEQVEDTERILTQLRSVSQSTVEDAAEQRAVQQLGQQYAQGLIHISQGD